PGRHSLHLGFDGETERGHAEPCECDGWGDHRVDLPGDHGSGPDSRGSSLQFRCGAEPVDDRVPTGRYARSYQFHVRKTDCRSPAHRTNHRISRCAHSLELAGPAQLDTAKDCTPGATLHHEYRRCGAAECAE